MTKKRPLRNYYHQAPEPVPTPDPAIYMPKVDHVAELLDIHRAYAEEAKRLIEELMKGYPERFVDIKAWDSGHREVLTRVAMIEKTVDGIVDNKEVYNRRLAIWLGVAVSLTGFVTTIIHMWWGKGS